MEKNHLRLVTSNDSVPNEVKTGPPRFRMERVFAIVAGGGLVLRYLLFALLVFLRIPVTFISRLVVGPLLFGAIAWGFIAGWTSTPALLLGGAAFILFLLGFAFDSLVLALAPDGYMLEL